MSLLLFSVAGIILHHVLRDMAESAVVCTLNWDKGNGISALALRIGDSNGIEYSRTLLLDKFLLELVMGSHARF